MDRNMTMFAKNRTSYLASIGIALLALTLWSPHSEAQWELNVVRSEVELIRIAVVPFGWSGQGSFPADNLADLVESNLGRTGLFAPIARSAMISNPTTGNQVQFIDWRVLDAEYLVIGNVSPAGTNEVQIQFEVFDVQSGSRLLGFQLRSSLTGLRTSGHRISDMIFEALTGIPGVFNTRLAYVAVQGDNPDNRTYTLIVADSDGHNASAVHRSSSPIMSPAWSPDARQLAYVSFVPDQEWGIRREVYVQTLSTGERQRVLPQSGNPSSVGAPVFSPDGQRLAVAMSQGTGGSDIYVLNLQTQALARVTQGASIDTEPSWTPDGQWIYFTSNRGGSTQIYRVRANGTGSVERVTFEGNYNARPRVAPNGQTMAVVHSGGSGFQIGLFDLQRNLLLPSLTTGTLDESPSFAPNGEVLIYATRDNGRGVLATVSRDGRVHQRLVDQQGVELREPVWSPMLAPVLRP